ncbi:hypothetical protein DFJ74DRAFT_687453 [Hyaloraphidium curvatum]|nr:hypothetical protein DFJ74DRAFT_687453 [Hyaloraphidium curvatum]
MPTMLSTVSHARVALTCLVPWHHSSIANGASGGWPFHDPSLPPGFVSPGLSIIAGVNQSFFMSEFFLLSGFFVEGGAAKRGLRGYMADRARRLGIPTVLYAFLVGPVVQAFCNAEMSLVKRSPTGAVVFEPLGTWLPEFAGKFLSELPKTARGRLAPGPLWFALAGIAFTAGFVGIRALFPRDEGTGRKPGTEAPTTQTDLVRRGALAYLALVPPASFAARLLFPIGERARPPVPAWLERALGRLGFQLGFFPGYVIAFALGIAGGRHLPTLFPAAGPDPQTSAFAARLLAFSLAAIPALPAYLFVRHAGDVGKVNIAGGFDLDAVAYALWEPAVAVGITAYSLVGTYPAFLATWWDSVPEGTRARVRDLLAAMDRASLATYVLHPIPTVLASVVLPHLLASFGVDWASLGTGLRAGATGLASIAGSWGLGLAMRSLPGADRFF